MEPAKQAVESVTEGVKKASLGGKKDKKKGGAGDAPQRAVEMSPPPEFLQHRLDMYAPAALSSRVWTCVVFSVVLIRLVPQFRKAQEEVR